MQDLNEFRSAIPRKENFQKSAFQQGEQILSKLRRAIESPQKSSNMYKLLVGKMKDRDVSVKTPYEVDLYPGIKIPVYVYIDQIKDNGRRAPLGSFGVKRPGLFKAPEPRITLALYGNVDYQMIVWNDRYYETMTHELTHMFQALDVALSYMKQKDQRITPQSVLSMVSKVGSRKGTSNFLKGIEKSDADGKLDKQLAYQASSPELGANAHAAISYLRKTLGEEVWRDAMEDIVSFADYGYPSIKDLDNAMRAADRQGRTVWGTYDKLIDQEKRVKNISRDEWTQGYEIKKKLLKTMSDFYKKHYK